MFKRGHKGIYHQWSPKHLHRYVTKFAGRHNLKPLGTDGQMAPMASGMVGRRLCYRASIRHPNDTGSPRPG